MRQVEVPGVGYVNYPDDWTDDQIREHATQHSQKWLAGPPEPPVAEPSDKTPPTGFLPNLSAGFRAAAGPGNLATYSAALASAADALGLPELRESALQYSAEQEQSAAAIPKSPVQPSSLLEQSRDPSGSLSLPSLLRNTRDYAGRTIGEAAGSALVPLGGALGGAGIGALIGGPPGAAIGALAGGGLAAQQMGAGDVYSEMAKQGTPAGQGLRAQAWGVPYGAAEMALGPEGAALAKYVMPILRSDILSPTVKQGLVRTAVKSGAQEAIANPLQEMMVIEAAREARGDPLETAMTVDNGWRLFDAMVGGAIGGAAMGGVVGALPGRSQGTQGTEPPQAESDSPLGTDPSQQAPGGLTNPSTTPITQDNVNPNPYGAVNENVYTMQAGPLGTVRADNPYTQVTPPEFPEEPAFKSPVTVKLPKGQGPVLTSAKMNLDLARKRAQSLLKKSEKKTKVQTPAAANDTPAATPVPQAETKVTSPAVSTEQKPQDTTSTQTPRYSVKPFGKKGEETYGIVDNTRKPRSKGWLVQKGLPSPEVAQTFADQFNGLEGGKSTPQSPPTPKQTPLQEPPAESKLPSVTPESKGFENVGNMAADIRDGAIDSLWKSTQIGKWAIAPEKAGLLEQVVDRLNKSGKLKSRQDVANVYDANISTAQEAADFVKSYKPEVPLDKLNQLKPTDLTPSDTTPNNITPPEIRKPSEKQSKAREAVKEVLTELGLSPRVRVDFNDTVEGTNDTSGGRYDPIDKSIKLAWSSSPDDLNHEMWHAFEDLGVVASKELETLRKYAKDSWVTKYKIKERWGDLISDGTPSYKELVAQHEAMAEAYADWVKGTLKPPSSFVQKIFSKISKFLERVKNKLSGYGFTTSEAIFEAVEKRKGKEVNPKLENADPRFSIIKELTKPIPDTGYMTSSQLEAEAKKLPDILRPKLDDIAAASEMLLGRPRKIGPVRAGVYSGWVNKFREVIQTARGLAAVNPLFASLYGKTSLRYATMKSIMDNYITRLHNGMLSKSTSKATQNKVMAALEIWNWKGERPDITGPLAVTNDVGNLDYSKKGEEIVLRSSEELNALRSTMEANDLMLTQLKHAVLKNLGVTDPNITPSEAKEKYEQLKEERDNTPRNERAGLQPEITRWKKINQELVDFDRLMKTAYLPRIRFGNAGLAVYKNNEKGEKELVHFQTIEGLDSKLKAYLRGPKVVDTIKSLKEQYPASEGYTVSNEAFPVTYNTIADLIRQRAQNKSNPYYALLDNIPTILTMLNQQQLEKLSDGNVREVQTYLARRLASGTVAKHMIEAKKILGADREVPRVLGQYGLSMATGIAKMQTAPMEQEAMSNILGSNDVKLIRYATDYLNYMDNPNEEWNRLKSLGFTWNLGFNPASAALNFANIATMYGPYVSQWATGIAPVTKSMGQSLRTSARILKHTAGIVTKAKSFDALPNPDLAIAITPELVSKGIVSQELYDYLNALNKDGVLDHGLSLEQLGAQPEYGSDLPEHRLGKGYQKAARSAATMFRWTEAMARLTSAISLYELTRNPQFIKNFEKSEGNKYVWQEESGGDPTEGKAGKATPENIAKYVLKYTFGDYDKANRPVFMRGFWGVVNQFSQYPVMMMETMFQNMKPFSNKQDAKTLAKMLGVAFLLSGLSGFAPGSDDLKRIIEGMYRVATGGQRLDLEKELLELMVERAGVDPGLARDVMYGPYRAVPGIESLPLVGSADISKRVALNTIPAIDTMLTMFSGNAQASPVTGPAGIVTKVSDAWDAYHRGTPYALTNLLPTAFHNVSQGFFEWADTGVRNRYNNIIIDPTADGPLALTANDYASKIIGFTPQKVSTARSMDRFERSISEATKDKKTHMRSQIMVAFQQQRIAAQRGDDERYEAATRQIQDYMQEIREYDADRPPSDKIGIKPKDLASIRREAIDSMGTAFKTEKRTPKAKRPEVNEMRERLFGDVLPPL